MKQKKGNILTHCLMALCSLLFAGAATQAHATTHPEYLHAIHDLRHARGLLQHGFGSDVSAEKVANYAISEIDDAIRYLLQAAGTDDKNLDKVPPIDADLPAKGRWHQALDLLNKAHQDASAPESDAAALAAERSGVQHIDKAIQIVEGAIK